MFGANAFGWPYLGQAYVGGGATNPEDSDTGTAADAVASLAVAVADTDTGTASEGTPSIGVSSSDTSTATSSASATATGNAPSDTDAAAATDALSALTANVSAADSATLAESPIVVTASDVAVNDTDTFTFDDSIFTNSSGGVADSFYGVVIAFGADAFDANPAWTRIDDPVGVA